jgi:hypothetical protein
MHDEILHINLKDNYLTKVLEILNPSALEEP